MSMHLEGPWLSTTNTKKRKVKFRSAEHKRAWEQSQAWEAELKKKYPALNSKSVKTSRNTVPFPNLNYERSTRHIPSLDTGMGGSTAPAPRKVYTGDKLVGIGTMHKSNMVPIFSDQEARDISTMRRN